MEKPVNPGLTLYVCIGKWGGVGIKWDMGLRVTLGWLSIALLYIDIERMTSDALAVGIQYKAERDRLLQAIMSRGGGMTH